MAVFGEIDRPTHHRENELLVRKCRRQVRKIAKLGRENLDFANQPSMTQRIQPTPPHRIGKLVRSRRKTQQFLVRVPTHVLPDALYRPDCLICVQQAFMLTAKGVEFLGKRGAGLNEA